MKLILLILLLAIVNGSNGKSNRASIPPNHIETLLRDIASVRMDSVLIWNLVTLQACANDYDPLIAPKPDQEGPAATTRAFAIIHGAMFNALNSFTTTYSQLAAKSLRSTTNSFPQRLGTDAAIMSAAYQTLSGLYPKQRPIFDAVYRFHLNQTRSNDVGQSEINVGLAVGQLTASFMMENRASDGSNANEYYIPFMSLGYHQQDPTNPNQGFIGSHWGKVKPFFLSSPSQFRPFPVVGDGQSARASYLNSTSYLTELDEVKLLGARNSLQRTPDQTRIGIAWAYDGAPKIGTPPRLYNQIARSIAIQENNSLERNAKLFALINYAMADAAIAAWDAKYYYNFWRPILGIRRSSSIFHADPTWVPLGAPADGAGSDFTPAFPAYVSGHATLGTATFQALRLFYSKDSISFRFQSDEYNGRTKDSGTGQVRPAAIRSYSSLTSAEEENADSRIYLGVHWRSDVLRGRLLGQQVAAEVFRKFN